MALAIKTQEEIFNDMVNFAVANGTPVTDFGVGTINGEMFRAVAWKVSQLYQDARIEWEETLNDFIFTTFKFKIKLGTQATGAAFFTAGTAPTSDIVIPIGTVIQTSDNVSFETTQTATIPSGNTQSNTVNIIASNVGTSGNVLANTITSLVSVINGVSGVSNPIATTGGVDKETEQEIEDRFALFVSSLVRSTTRGILTGALSVEGVKRAFLIEDLGLFAIGSVTFTTNTAPVGGILIPKGTRVKTTSEVVFQTTADITVAEGQTSGVAIIRARDKGLFGIVSASAINTIVDAIQDVLSVDNASATTGGSDGILGRLQLFVDDGSGSVSTAVMTAVQLRIEGDGTENEPGFRPAGIIIIFDTPEVVNIDITQEVFHEKGINISDVKSAVETAQQTYINNLDMGETVILERLHTVAMQVTGVIDIQISVPSGNFQIGTTQVAKIGTVITTMTEGEPT